MSRKQYLLLFTHFKIIKRIFWRKYRNSESMQGVVKATAVKYMKLLCLTSVVCVPAWVYAVPVTTAFPTTTCTAQRCHPTHEGPRRKGQELRHRYFWVVLPTAIKGETMDGTRWLLLARCPQKMGLSACWCCLFLQWQHPQQVLLPRITGKLGLTSFHTDTWSTFSSDSHPFSRPSLHLHVKIQLWELAVGRCAFFFLLQVFRHQ